MMMCHPNNNTRRRQCATSTTRHHDDRATMTGHNERKDSADKSLEGYKAASDIAVTELPPMNPIRLGLALNFSVEARSM